MNDATHFTNFDYVIIGVMVFSCVFAFFRGLVREILSLIAWVGAGAVTIYYFPSASAKLQEHFKSPMVAAAIAGVGIYLLALIAFGLLNMIIIRSFKSGSEGGMLDNLLGLIFGAARGALMVSLGFFLLTIALPEKEYPDWLKDSVTRPYVAQGAALLTKVAPNVLQDIASLQLKMQSEVQGGNQSPGVVDPNAANTKNGINDNDLNEKFDAAGIAHGGNTTGTGYSHTTTQQLDRLIESSSPAR